MKTYLRGFVVSTIELPFPHIGGTYESMVFRTDADGNITDWSELLCRRYVTSDAAEKGHSEIVNTFDPNDYTNADEGDDE